jgi:hypothetical protein
MPEVYTTPGTALEKLDFRSFQTVSDRIQDFPALPRYG